MSLLKANAKSRASQAVNAGRMSASTKAAIDSKANRILGTHSNVRNASTHAGKLKHC
jgi:hypothetical protein